MAAEKLHRLYWDQHGIRTTVLRLTVPYGGFQSRQNYSHGIVDLFFGRASRDESIVIYGTGAQLRDVIHLDDVVSAILNVALTSQTEGQVYNLGSGEGISLKRVAELVTAAVGKGSITYVDWPEDALRIETGDFFCRLIVFVWM